MQKHVDNNSPFTDSKGENLAQTLSIDDQNDTVVSHIAKQIPLPLTNSYHKSWQTASLGILGKTNSEKVGKKNYKCCTNKNILKKKGA